MKDLYIIKDRLREALNAHSMSPTDLSRACGLNKSTICRYLSGERIPRTDAIHKMAAALNVNPSWLLGYDVPMVEGVDYLAAIGEETFLIEKLTPENRAKLATFIDFLLAQQEGADNETAEI